MVQVNALLNTGRRPLAAGNVPPVRSLDVGSFDDTGARNALAGGQQRAQAGALNQQRIEANDAAQAEEIMNDFVAATFNARTPEEFEAGKAAFAQRRGIDPQNLAQVTFDQLPALKREAEGVGNIFKAQRKLAQTQATGGLTAAQSGKRAALIRGGVSPEQADLIVGGALKATDVGVQRLDTGERVTKPLTKGAKTAAQKSLSTAEEQLGKIKRLRSGFDKSFLTTKGRIRAFVAREADKLQDFPVIGDTVQDKLVDKKFLTGFTKFTQNIRQVFNQYRKEITGAAAAIQELKELEKAVVNINQGPTEFEASLDNMEQAVEDGVRIKRKLLREGIDVSDPDFGERFDQEWANRRQAAAALPTTGQVQTNAAPGVESRLPTQTQSPSDGQSLATTAPGAIAPPPAPAAPGAAQTTPSGLRFRVVQ